MLLHHGLASHAWAVHKVYACKISMSHMYLHVRFHHADGSILDALYVLQPP